MSENKIKESTDKNILIGEAQIGGGGGKLKRKKF